MYSSPFHDVYLDTQVQIAVNAGMVVMANDYMLARRDGQGGTYPTIIRSTQKALEYLATHGPQHDGQDAKIIKCNEPGGGPKIFIAGDSSGGGTAYSLMVALSAGTMKLNNGMDSLSGGVFWSPWVNLMCNNPTYITNSFHKVPKADVCDESDFFYNGDVNFHYEGSSGSFVPGYIGTNFGSPSLEGLGYRQYSLDYVGGDMFLLKDKIASPIFANEEVLKNLPPVMFIAGDQELLLGEIIVAAQSAAAAGAQTILDIYNGMWHVFPQYYNGCGAGPIWEAHVALNRTYRFLREVSSKGKAPCSPMNHPGHPATLFHQLKPGTCAESGEDWVPFPKEFQYFPCPEVP
jgi:acetyl esterase/lipase